MACHKTKASSGKGKYRIEAEARIIGKDILVTVWGGTHPHIGSVAVAVPRNSLADPAQISATSSVINLVGHKDDAVARLFSERTAAYFNRNCIATAGIHIDNADKEEIELIIKTCEALCSRILTKLEKYK